MELSPTNAHSATLNPLGTDGPTTTDETSEKFQTASDPPPPHFGKIMLRISRQNCDKIATKVRMFIMAGLLCII